MVCNQVYKIIAVYQTISACVLYHSSHLCIEREVDVSDHYYLLLSLEVLTEELR